VDLLELIMLVDGGTLEKMGRDEVVLYTWEGEYSTDTVLWFGSICMSVLGEDVVPNEMLDFPVDILELIVLVDGSILERMGRDQDVL
jgi:hypothetical protein